MKGDLRRDSAISEQPVQATNQQEIVVSRMPPIHHAQQCIGCHSPDLSLWSS